MIEPIIGFCIFFLVVSIIIYIGNRARKKEYENILEITNDNIVFKKEQAKCSVTTIGLKNNNYLFRNCDIYITENSIILFGYSKKRLIKQLSTPIILTNQIEKTKRIFPTSIIKTINKISINDDKINIEFGDKGNFNTYVKLKLKKLNNDERNQLFNLIRKTVANIGYAPGGISSSVDRLRMRER